MAFLIQGSSGRCCSQTRTTREWWVITGRTRGFWFGSAKTKKKTRRLRRSPDQEKKPMHAWTGPRSKLKEDICVLDRGVAKRYILFHPYEILAFQPAPLRQTRSTGLLANGALVPCNTPGVKRPSYSYLLRSLWLLSKHSNCSRNLNSSLPARKAVL